MAPRDNVIFEFGLFAGRLGRQRAFLMAESGLKIPSDLSGISLPFFPSARVKGGRRPSPKAQSEQKKGVTACCARIEKHIRSREGLHEFGFFPSTSLAYGYFNNFVVKVISHLLEAKTMTPVSCDPKTGKATELKFNDVELSILIPNDLRADMFDQVKEQRHRNGWQLIKVAPAGFRPFDFYVQKDRRVGGVECLSDIPITLNALNESIQAYIGKSYIGVSQAEKLLEGRELRTFTEVLEHLIGSNPITRKRVKIEVVPI